MLTKCFGIISWLPDNAQNRIERQLRIDRLLKQLNDLWPDIDVLIIAQNWQDFKPTKIKNKLIIKNYDPLGILKARQTLREEFLKLSYDYIIMFDDDAIIQYDNDTAAIEFMNELDSHKNGFCFIHGNNSPYHPYTGAQLNLCAISKFIYNKEPIVPIDPQQNEGFEDSIYSCLLHHKYSSYEFTPPVTIRTIQFQINNEPAQSTWWNSSRPCSIMLNNTHTIEKYILQHKDFPKNYKELLLTENNNSSNKSLKEKELYVGDKNSYLYF